MTTEKSDERLTQRRVLAKMKGEFRLWDRGLRKQKNKMLEYGKCMNSNPVRLKTHSQFL